MLLMLDPYELAQLLGLRARLEKLDDRMRAELRKLRAELLRRGVGHDGPAGPAGAQGPQGTTGGSAGSLLRLAMYWKSSGSIESFQVWPYFSNATGQYLSGAVDTLGAADLALVRNATGAARTVRWRVEYTAAQSVVIRIRKYSSGAWSTAATQNGSSGTQAYTGTVSLADGELLGAHVESTPGQAIGPFAFYLD